MSATPSAGLDLRQALNILRATLLMRLRTGGGTRLGRGGKPRGLIFLGIFYAVMGMFVGMLAPKAHVDVFTYALILFAMTFFLGGSMVVSESSQVLFNPSESDILGHRPIHPRTLLLAKSLSLFLLSAGLAVALNLAALVMGTWIVQPVWVFPIVHFVVTLLLALLASGSVVFVYALLTRWVGRERFDSFISWVQVLTTAGLLIGYQVVPRMIQRFRGFRIDSNQPWLPLLPPAWFAALESLMVGVHPTPRLLVMAGLALTVTIGVSWAAVARLSEAYARTLSALSETPAALPRPRADVERRSRPLNPLLAAWLRDPVERGVYRLMRAYMTRDRDVRMRLYPSLATILVFAILPMIESSMNRAGPLFALMFIGMLTNTAMATLKMSPQYAAGDVFRYAPLASSAAIFHGARKAVIVGFVLPAFAMIVPVLWFTVRQHQLLLTILPVLAAMPTLSLINGLVGDYVPLSVPMTIGRQGAMNILYMSLGALAAAGISAVSVLSIRMGWFWPFLAIEVVVLAGIHAVLLRGIRVRPFAAALE